MMAPKKSPLGKGLEALIPDLNIGEFKDGVEEIDINEIEPNADQPRKNFDEEKLQQLADSIKEHGVVQPVLVKREGQIYRLIAGERRWRAARQAGLKTIPAIEKEFTEREIMEISLIENLQREDLNPIEEAEAYAKLAKDFKMTQDDIAERIGKSRPAVSNIMRLLNLDERVKGYVVDGIISEGHARCLITIPNKEIQYEIARKVIDGNLNVRQTEKIVKSFAGKKKRVIKTVRPLFITEAQERLTNALGTKVTVSHGRKKGKIEIEYYNLDDLERIMDMLKA